jgi:hypothetical protein
MKKHYAVGVVISFCLTLLFSLPVMADSNHFVIEPFTGVNLQHSSADNKAGLESGVLFGIGGKFKGFPPLFFLYFRSSYSFFGNETITNDDYSTSLVHRSYTRLSGGLRVIIPLLSQLRMNLEVGGGKIFTYEQYDLDGIHTGSYEDSMGILEFGAGLNYRIFQWLSVGLITNYAMVLDGRHNDRYALHYNNTSPNWISITATLGLHF